MFFHSQSQLGRGVSRGTQEIIWTPHILLDPIMSQQPYFSWGWGLISSAMVVILLVSRSLVTQSPKCSGMILDTSPGSVPRTSNSVEPSVWESTGDLQWITGDDGKWRVILASTFLFLNLWILRPNWKHSFESVHILHSRGYCTILASELVHWLCP